jgi:hypothetical protein
VLVNFRLLFMNQLQLIKILFFFLLFLAFMSDIVILFFILSSSVLDVSASLFRSDVMGLVIFSLLPSSLD